LGLVLVQVAPPCLAGWLRATTTGLSGDAVISVLAGISNWALLAAATCTAGWAAGVDLLWSLALKLSPKVFIVFPLCIYLAPSALVAAVLEDVLVLALAKGALVFFAFEVSVVVAFTNKAGVLFAVRRPFLPDLVGLIKVGAG